MWKEIGMPVNLCHFYWVIHSFKPLSLSLLLCVCYVIYCFLLHGSFFYPEDEETRYLWNFIACLPDYVASHPRTVEYLFL